MIRAFLADFLAIALFAFLARVAHNTPELPLSFSGWLTTMLPFSAGVMIAWLVYIARMKSKRDRSLSTQLPPSSLCMGLGVWCNAVIVGLGIWCITHAKIPHWSFMIVATVMSGLLILSWRGVLLLLSRLR